MPFLYDTHLHTRYASACSEADPKQYVKLYKSSGFSGFVVTDHFFNGNCRITTGTWKDKVEAYTRGYEIAAEEGYKYNFSVFFGWEATYEGDDYLVYGLDKAWLLDHPEIVTASRREQYEIIHKHGGVVVQAHPFRNRSYISTIHLSPTMVDAVEVANEGNQISYDQSAYAYALENKLFMTCGSDIHRSEMVGPDTYGVISHTKWQSIDDYVKAIRNKEALGLHCPKMCFFKCEKEPELPVVYCYD